MKTGIDRIAEERQRQVTQEGWTPEHDDTHTGEELAWAATCYAAPGGIRMATGGRGRSDPWPWDGDWDKRGQHDRITELAKAGALIAAEIDRLDRAQQEERTK